MLLLIFSGGLGVFFFIKFSNEMKITKWEDDDSVSKQSDFFFAVSIYL